MNKEEIDIILKGLKEHRLLGDSEDIYLFNYINEMRKENKQLQERIDKAIEEIDNNLLLLPTEYADEVNNFKRKLREILKGEDK